MKLLHILVSPCSLLNPLHYLSTIIRGTLLEKMVVFDVHNYYTAQVAVHLNIMAWLRHTLLNYVMCILVFYFYCNFCWPSTAIMTMVLQFFVDKFNTIIVQAYQQNISVNYAWSKISIYTVCCCILL